MSKVDKLIAKWRYHKGRSYIYPEDLFNIEARLLIAKNLEGINESLKGVDHSLKILSRPPGV